MSSVVEEIRAEVEEAALAKGRAEGRTEGRAEGALEEKKATIRQLLKMGSFTLESIAEITRLSLDEVRALAESDAG